MRSVEAVSHQLLRTSNADILKTRMLQGICKTNQPPSRVANT